MGIETFPEIENFQKLPRQVIVKGGSSTFRQGTGAELCGIVINNIGQAICQVRVHLIIFENKVIPILNTSTLPNPEDLAQGGIGSFAFLIQDYPSAITDYHLYATWKFNDRE